MLKFINSAPAKVKIVLNKCREIYDSKKSIALCTVSAILAFITVMAANYRVGYTVKVDNTIIGTVATKSEYYDVVAEIKAEVSNISEIEFEPANTEEFKVEIVSVGAFTDKEQLAENVKSITDGMVEAYSVNSEGSFVAAFATEDEAQSFKAEYIGNNTDSQEQNDAQVEIVKGYVPGDVVQEYGITAKAVMSEEITESDEYLFVGTGEFIMPTSGTLSSPYGRRWGKMHHGIDLAASTGTAIYASDSGIVLESEYQNNGYGNIVKIDHQNGYVTYYAHCSELYVSAGDKVTKGDKIATVGSTGRSTGPHLHFEIRKDEASQNPYNYIK